MLNVMDINTDEKTYQIMFYESIFGKDRLANNIHFSESTDGYTDGIMFEHKQNVKSWGRSRTLGQALLYLVRLNKKGIPVPGKVMLVSQDEELVYLYNSNDYSDIVNNIEEYGKLTPSNGIEGFIERNSPQIIEYNMFENNGMEQVIAEIKKEDTFVKVKVNIHNVYEWSNFYYQNAAKYNQKPEKKKFFEELRNPVGALKDFIEPWDGNETDFAIIMDLLNDPLTQKTLGAFYTPEPYCQLAAKLLDQAIANVPEGWDYVVIDRCAGTGQLENVLSDEILSHVIVNTLELKEWYVLNERVGSRVRAILPEVKEGNSLPELDPNTGMLKGADALSEDFIHNLNNVIESTKKSNNVVRIILENPPFAETTSIEFQKKGVSDECSKWSKSFVVSQLKEYIKDNPVIHKAASREMGNAFIWSGFEYILKSPYDSQIVFSPVKYYKSQHLVDKKFVDGYAVNRRHFHTKIDACIMIALWSNVKESINQILALKAIDLNDDSEYIDNGAVIVKPIYDRFQEVYVDSDRHVGDIDGGIVCELNGTEKLSGKIYTKPRYNDDIIGYVTAWQPGFDNPDLNSGLTTCARYVDQGQYLRKDNFIEKLPLFAASRYVTYNRFWTERGRVMKSADGAQQFFDDVASGASNDFLTKCLIFTCFEPHNHCRSFYGSDGRLYLNQMCFDDNTVASDKLNELIADGYNLSHEEQNLLNDWKAILTRVKTVYDNGEYRYPYSDGIGYNPNFTYGLYQIDQEINFKIEKGFDRTEKPKKVFNDGDLNNMIKRFKAQVKEYYLNNLVEPLFQYQFLK